MANHDDDVPSIISNPAWRTSIAHLLFPLRPTDAPLSAEAFSRQKAVATRSHYQELIKRPLFSAAFTKLLKNVRSCATSSPLRGQLSPSDLVAASATLLFAEYWLSNSKIAKAALVFRLPDNAGALDVWVKRTAPRMIPSFFQRIAPPPRDPRDPSSAPRYEALCLLVGRMILWQLIQHAITAELCANGVIVQSIAELSANNEQSKAKKKQLKAIFAELIRRNLTGKEQHGYTRMSVAQSDRSLAPLLPYVAPFEALKEINASSKIPDTLIESLNDLLASNPFPARRKADAKSRVADEVIKSLNEDYCKLNDDYCKLSERERKAAGSDPRWHVSRLSDLQVAPQTEELIRNQLIDPKHGRPGNALSAPYLHGIFWTLGDYDLLHSFSIKLREVEENSPEQHDGCWRFIVLSKLCFAEGRDGWDHTDWSLRDLVEALKVEAHDALKSVGKTLPEQPKGESSGNGFEHWSAKAMDCAAAPVTRALCLAEESLSQMPNSGSWNDSVLEVIRRSFLDQQVFRKVPGANTQTPYSRNADAILRLTFVDKHLNDELYVPFFRGTLPKVNTNSYFPLRPRNTP